MRLLFKQRFLSWFASYDIYDEAGNTVYTVKGQLSWGHRLEIYDAYGQNIGTVKEEIFTLLPRCVLYINGQPVGQIKKEFTLFKPVYTLDCNGWRVEGDFLGWDYQVTDPAGSPVMQALRQLNWTDTFIIDIPDPANALIALMVVLAIDIANAKNN